MKLNSKLYIPAVLLASLFLGACGSDDDNQDSTGKTPIENSGGEEETQPPAYTVTEVAGEPGWRIDWQYSQDRPGWQEPSPSDYEYWTVVKVEIEDELKAMTSRDDLVGVFIDGELCGMSSPAVSIGDDDEEDINPDLYIMKVYSNRAVNDFEVVTLQYYSARLQHLFTGYGEITFNSYAETPHLMPQFTLGASKYAMNNMLKIQITTTAASGVVPAEGDRLAAFVGDECRGVCMLDDLLFSDPIWLQVLGQHPDEVVTLKYYHAATRQVFTFNQTVRLSDDQLNVSLSL